MKHILDEDLALLDERVRSIQQEIFALGEDFNEAVNQSSETWHDNAPFDVVRDRQTLLNSELAKLRTIRRESRKLTAKKTKKVTIGSKVELTGPRTLKIMLGGHWIGREKVDGYTLVTCESPVAKLLIGKKLYDTVELPVGQSIVTDVL
jgi:transcription elongation GreA/GreB family factor